jgi:DNA-binding MarR family transcriptional regulator
MQAITVSLTPAERELLAEILEESLGNRRVEVRRTEFSTEFRQQLQQQEELVRGLLDKVSKAGATA